MTEKSIIIGDFITIGDFEQNIIIGEVIIKGLLRSGFGFWDCIIIGDFIIIGDILKSRVYCTFKFF